MIRFDCSNDLLVTISLSSILESYFPLQNKQSLLIADEYHLLSDDHKYELYQWIETKISWLNVILVGNRKSEVDQSLFSNLQHDYKQNGSKTHFEVIDCVLSWKRYSTVYSKQLKKQPTLKPLLQK